MTGGGGGGSKEEKRQKAALQVYLDECEKAKKDLETKRNVFKAKRESLKNEREREETLAASPATTSPLEKTVVEPDQGWKQSRSASAKKRERKARKEIEAIEEEEKEAAIKAVDDKEREEARKTRREKEARDRKEMAERERKE